jgi:F-type H+-transporting ATPase subunit a
VRPFIQLPGEVFPGTSGIPILNGLTNTFVSSLLVYGVMIAIIIALRARSRSADEVPTGFYNFFEMVVEAAYNFAEGIAGKKVRDFFPYFMTFLLFILLGNWMALLPGFDSIGVWEFKPHFYGEKEVKAYIAENGEFASEEAEEEFLHEVEEEIDAENRGDYRNGLLLIRASDGNTNEGDLDGEHAGTDPSRADWTIVPFVRPANTDLNLTLALALISMTMVQFYGFKYLGAGYLKKFFNLPISAIAKDPIKALDPVVGILELIGEISRIISFAFRLLGNIFAGMVLLFVMGFLLPVANIAFFGLELFVGLIQAVVFAMLTLVFMQGATESHHDEEHH